MCGIAGILQTNTEDVADVESLRRTLEAMRYRGPDHLGIFAHGALAMGNVRLAIQGIESSGNQPIYNENRTVAVVFNGEIYNYPELRKELEAKGHHFSTATDTEVLVHLYEEAGSCMADRLNGMFAFAIYDLRSKQLLLGRDKTAQKPFFFFRSEKSIAFASELRALLEWVPHPTLDLNAARDFLSLGYFLEPTCIVENVECLPPGSVSVFNDRAEMIHRHEIPLPKLSLNAPAELPAWLEEADGIFTAAVHRHTLSDVPVTVFLSGGVDSTLIALYLGHASKVKTVYTGSFADEADYDEFSFSSALAKQLGLAIERVDLRKPVLAGAIEAFCADSSQPQGDYSGLPTYILARETARNFRVVLGGDAGDELFSGYPTYILPKLQQRFGMIPTMSLHLAAALARRGGPVRGYMPLRFRLQLLAQAWGLDTPQAHFSVKDFLPPTLASGILSQEKYRNPASPPPGQTSFANWFGANDGKDEIRRLGRLDFQTFLGSCTIPKMERNCMHWSLENRLPFLDNNVLALAARTPVELQRKGGMGKWCLRQLLEKKLGAPPHLNPRKQGFGPPMAQMLQEELSEWSQELLDRPHPLFAPGCATLLRQKTAQGWDLHRLIWNICILKDWTLRNGIAS